MVETFSSRNQLYDYTRGGFSRRKIELEGIINTRDLGGILAKNDRCVIPKKLIRSASLSSATSQDAVTLTEHYGVQKVIDLRTETENKNRPNPQELFCGVMFVNIPLLSSAEMGITREGLTQEMIAGLKEVASHPVELMMRLYPRILLDETSQQGFKSFFDELLSEGSGAVLWHCSVGKDRVGLATALLLTALDIPQEAIMQDYLMTNEGIQDNTQELLSALASYRIADDVRGSIQILNSADPRFLQSAIDAANKEFGSLEGYLREALDMTTDKVEALQARYLMD